jgi:low temperature requirement protein LtrA
MDSQQIVSPEEQPVTFVELFFDLVFVFSVTQVVGLLHDGLTWIALGQAVLVFWLVWWAWTQFTWSLNAMDTTHTLVELGVLIATAVAFFMAVALPEAFHDLALWFGIAYVLVRVIGLLLYIWVASAVPSMQRGVFTFTAISIGGLIAVLLGGYLGGAAQFWLWALAILLDVVASAVAGQIDGWNLHPEHFVERHGLFIIIALGETLIVAAGGVTEAQWTFELVIIAVLTVVITCGLWWSYFPQIQPVLDKALGSRLDSARVRMARDAFSLLHFLMVCGVIAYAVSVEEAVAHPGESLPLTGRIALAVSLVLFIGGMAAVFWRSTGHLPRPRVAVTAVAAIAIVALPNVSPITSLAIAGIGVWAIAIFETGLGRRWRDAFPDPVLKIDT